MNDSVNIALEFLYQSIVWFAQNINSETEYLKQLHTREVEIIKKREANLASIIDFQKTMREKIEELKASDRRVAWPKVTRKKKTAKKNPKRKK